MTQPTETVQFPMITTTAKMAQLQNWGRLGNVILSSFGKTEVDDESLRLTTLLEKTSFNDVCYYRKATPEYDLYFGKYIEWCIYGILPFVKNSPIRLGIQSLLRYENQEASQHEYELAKCLLNHSLVESVKVSESVPAWVNPVQAAETEFLRAANTLPVWRSSVYSSVTLASEASAKAIALLSTGYFKDTVKETNMDKPSDGWQEVFNCFYGKVKDYQMVAFRRMLDSGTLPTVSYPFSLDSLLYSILSSRVFTADSAA